MNDDLETLKINIEKLTELVEKLRFVTKELYGIIKKKEG